MFRDKVYIVILILYSSSIGVLMSQVRSNRVHVMGSYEETSPQTIDSLLAFQNNVLWRLNVPFFYTELLKIENFEHVDTNDVQNSMQHEFTMKALKEFDCIGVNPSFLRGPYLKNVLDVSTFKVLSLEIVQHPKFKTWINDTIKMVLSFLNRHEPYDSVSKTNIESILIGKIPKRVLDLIILEMSDIDYFKGYEQKYASQNEYLFQPDYLLKTLLDGSFNYYHEIKNEPILFCFSGNNKKRRKQIKQFSKYFGVDRKELKEKKYYFHNSKYVMYSL